MDGQVKQTTIKAQTDMAQGLDWNRAGVLAELAGDQELLQELIQLFVDSSTADLGELTEALAQGDCEQAGSAAHSVKGAAASLSIKAIRDAALAVELACHDGKVEVARNRTVPLAGLLERFRETVGR